MNSKAPWESKTIIVNGVLGLAAFASIFLPQAASIQPWIASNGANIAMFWSVLNIVLRAVSKDKISLGD